MLSNVAFGLLVSFRYVQNRPDTETFNTMIDTETTESVSWEFPW